MPAAYSPTPLPQKLGIKPAMPLIVLGAPWDYSTGVALPAGATVSSRLSNDAAFIHQEIWTDNAPNKGPRPQLLTFNLHTEPWLFVIGSDGRISTRIEGAFSVDELNKALDKVS